MTVDRVSVLLLVASLPAAGAVLVWPGRPTVQWAPHPRAPRSHHPSRTGASGDRARRRGGSRARWWRRGRSTTHAPGALVPDAMELMALALSGGCSVGTAARTACRTLPEPFAGQLASVAEALLRGGDTDGAWREAGTHWAPARRCLDLAEVAGVAPADALVRAAQDLRRDAVVDVEVASARLGVRLVLPLGFAYLPAFVLTTIVPLVIALTADLSW